MTWQKLGCWVYQPRISGITGEHQGSLEPPADGGGDARSPSEPPGGPSPANPGFGLLASRAGRKYMFVVETPSLWSLVTAASGQSFQKIGSWVGSNVHRVLRVHLDTCSQHVGVCLLLPRALLFASLSFALWLFHIPASGPYSLLLGGHNCAFETKGHLGNNSTLGPGNLERLLSAASPSSSEPSLLSSCSGDGAGLVVGVSQTLSQRQEPGFGASPRGPGTMPDLHPWKVEGEEGNRAVCSAPPWPGAGSVRAAFLHLAQGVTQGPVPHVGSA